MSYNIDSIEVGAFKTLRDLVLPAFEGSADLVLCWEGGESFSGLRLRDGKVTKHKVKMALGEEMP